MPPSGAKFPTCWKMHRRASHAIFIHRRGFSTFRRECECVASQRVARPIEGGGGHVLMLVSGRWTSPGEVNVAPDKTDVRYRPVN